MTGVSQGIGPRIPLVVGVLLLVLAGAARWWPDEPFAGPGGTLLVLLPEPDLRREEALDGLADHLATTAGVDLRLAIARDLAGLHEQAADALLVMGPDAAVLSLDPAAWYPLVSGRRRAPWNLRPVPVVVSRRSVAEAAQPWRTAPRRTVVGDSLSLVCRALLGPAGLAAAREAGVSWGRDPYDHRPVLWALEMGAFDHAVVRQWDAEAMVAAGHLVPERWRVQAAGDPVPDVLVVASRRLPTARRVPLQQALSLLGRSHDVADLDCRAVTAGLGLLGLDGFNLLTPPDLDQVRRRHAACWPAAGP